MNSLTKFTSRSKSTRFKDILPWNISQVIPKTVPISTRIVKSYAMKWGIHYEFDGKSMETETTTWSEFPNEGKPIVEQILASEERNKSKKSGIWESQSGIRVGKLTIWARSFEFTRTIGYSRIGYPVLMMNVRVSKDKKISRWVDRVNLIYVRWGKGKRGKRSKTLSEVKLVKNISKNLQSFPEISPVQFKSFFHITYTTMHMSTKILSDQRKITSHTEIARINWVIQVCLIQSKNDRRVWFKERFTINKIRAKTSNICKAKLLEGYVIQNYLVYMLLIIWP